MPEISVVVPVYKVSEYLKRCVDSILAQTYTSFDLILIDDGSPDDCGEICDRYQNADNKVHVIHQENQGLAEARNVGIEWALKNSDSKWITFIDSDDWIHQDYLKLLYETAIKYSVDLSICNCIKTPELNIEEPEVNGNTKIFAPEDFWCFRQYGGAWAKLYKKSHFENIRYPKGLLYEDIFVTYRLIFMQSKVAYIETPLYFYFLRDDSITKSQWNPRVLAQFDGMKQQLEFFKKNNYKRAYEITARNYLLHIKNNTESCKTVKNKYPKEYKKLKRMYKSNLVRFHKLLPIRNNINLYRYGFPWIVKLYKKFTYIKELVGFGK
ncbi:MAG: glycosyltransferase family 2 protein [Clostridia bacterium]|nr:glycosyltransferase family 2 protein [Clostridia bacterium]